MRADVAIVGGGTAGAALASILARRGVRVVLVERRPLTEAGARWVNGVAAWMFDEAGIARPTGAELRGAGHAFHLLAGWGPTRVTVTSHEVLDVDMRHLVARLQRDAAEHGATLMGDVRVTGLEGTRLATTRGAIEADTIVDASGLAGARLLAMPRVPKHDVCVAAQEVRRVRDAKAAEAFFVAHDAAPGDTLCFSSVAGGYSIVNVRLDSEGVSLLTGSIPGDRQPTGRVLLERFVAEQPWIGETLFGGARAIPLGTAHAELARGRVAALGDAALQVFSAHGSGIGAGMVAARLLADAIERSALFSYAVTWHRQYGPRFAAYEAFRRFSQKLTVSEVTRLMQARLIDETTARGALEMRLPRVAPADVTARGRRLLREGTLAARLIGAVTRATLAAAHQKTYPRSPEGLRGWHQRARVLGLR